ncbi:MAG: efflux RND transporter periplasmic adaptor subunit [Candidatus Pacebacteria bacterium]|nr:efflux RND transporter periplasmic adaptor subunit [Candidatus Paceibacterota bacterium]
MNMLMKTMKSIFKIIKKNWKIFLVLFIIIGIVIFWQVRKANNNSSALAFEPVKRTSLTKTLDISGIIDAKEKANMRFLAGGKLVYLGAQEGEWVKKWQTIASIDKALLQKQLNQNLNSYMKERWDFEDTQDQYDYNKEDLSTRKTIDKEQWDLENTVLTVEIKDIAIRDSSIYAPFAGVLVKSPTTVTGVQLLATDYFEIVNPQTLIFKAEVDESDIGLLSINQQAEVELDAYDNEIINTYLNYVAYSSSVNSTGTVFLVEFPINSEDIDKYRIGMNGDVSIILDKKDDILVIPFEATISRDDKTYVNVQSENNKTEEREIVLGLETDDYAEVLSGLEEGELILIPE